MVENDISLLLLQIAGKLFGYPNLFVGRFERCVVNATDEIRMFATAEEHFLLGMARE